MMQLKSPHFIVTVVSILTLMALGIWCKEIKPVVEVVFWITVLPLIYWSFISLMFFLKSVSFEKYIINRMLTPLLSLAVVCMTICAFSLHQVEKNWFAKDSIFSLDPTGLIKLEAEVTVNNKHAISKILEPLK